MVIVIVDTEVTFGVRLGVQGCCDEDYVLIGIDIIGELVISAYIDHHHHRHTRLATSTSIIDHPSEKARTPAPIPGAFSVLASFCCPRSIFDNGAYTIRLSDSYTASLLHFIVAACFSYYI
jgi:hypothetical protein